MKIIIKIIFPVLIVTGISTFWIVSCSKPDEKNPACTGKDRWDTKTLTDISASSINYIPVATTINNLISIPLVNTINANTPRFGIEFNTYTIYCHIREYKLSDDGDYHLVLQDISNPAITMIGEIPDPYCESVKQSIRLSEITQARTDFKNSLLVTEQVDASVYIITGVAFYDKVHGQLGAAPNAIEIHPILSIAKK
jgi:hypothetical protein